MGKEVATLVRGKKAAGEYQVHWDASHLPGGLYIYRLQAGEYAENKKLVLLK
ncbi:T9SS type A sorting domain-containing protein [candidate division KSB1 bacterium]|nr:T9SS type A sorting domain-containing protein [candidate division KSB1 bacterium]